MKIITFLLLVLLICSTAVAQVAINETGDSPNSNSILDVKSSTKGMLVPRMTTLERTTLGNLSSGDESGMLVYDIEEDAFYYFDGVGSWIKMAVDAAISDWTVSGDNMYSAVSGDVGIGKSTNFQGKLDVVGKVYVDNSSGDGVQVNIAGTPTIAPLSWGSSLNNGVEVNGAEGNGVFVGSTDKSGLYVQNAAENGISVNNADIDGINILATNRNGVFVNSVGNKGFNILDVGGASTIHSSAEKNGFDVAGTAGNGLYVGQADGDGIKIYRVGEPVGGIYTSSESDGIEINTVEGNGVFVGKTGSSGIQIINAGDDGIYIGSTADKGIVINNASTDGMYVNAGEDGIRIYSAGAPSSIRSNAFYNGVEVSGAEGNGLYIGIAGESGVYISEAADDGVYANTIQASKEWGIYTPDKIHAANVTAKSNSTYGINTGNILLKAGDVVCISGGMESNIDRTESLFAINLEKANDNNKHAVFGVVEYKVNIENKDTGNENSDTERKRFVHSDGDIYSGEYFSVVISGPAEVNVDSKTNIKTGSNVCIDNNGVSEQRVTQINGVSIAENVGIIGKSLGETATGKMLVYVNCK